MDFVIREEAVTIKALKEYEEVPIAFTVNSVYAVKPVDSGLSGLALTEEVLETSWIKDYDEHEKPHRWAENWDTSNWGILSVFKGRKRIGGAVIAYNTNGVNMLEGRDDIAVLWDIRIHPDFRRKGIGKKLFERVVGWTKERKCKFLKIETQNINVRACKFYAKQGATLGNIKMYAYKEYPQETMLIWYLKLNYYQ